MKYQMAVLTAFLFFLASVTALTAQNKDSVQGDFEALQDLYEVTDGNNWTNNTGWGSMTPENMGDAFGVTVNELGRVTELRLTNNNLVNYELDEQEKPVFDQNNKYILIQGRALKESIGNLKQLKHLHIQRNKLTGNIPDSFYTLVNLEYAILGYNDTSDLSEKTWIYPSKNDYVGNKFTGGISSAIGSMTSLKRLFLDRNYFTGTSIPSEIGMLSNLEYLSLHRNGLNGQLPPSLGNLSNLIFLNLTGGDTFAGQNSGTDSNETNSFEGEIPSELGQLSKLRSLRLSYHRFIGGFPLSFANLSSMQEFIASNNFISAEPFPNHINNDNMPKMTTFFIRHNNLVGTIDPEWNGSNINVFNLQNNNVGGELPKSFTDSSHPNFNSKITIFEIQHNNFEGNFADSIEDWFRPRRIMMHANNFSGPLPAVFPVHTSDSRDQLAAMSLSNNGFTGNIPVGMGQMTTTRTHYIGLSNNNLTGYDTGAISPLVLDEMGDYVSGLRAVRGVALDGNELPQSALDQIILDMWDNVQSRLGTEWENWESGALRLQNQSTGSIPSNNAAVNSAIQGLRSAGWDVQYDGSDSDDRTFTFPEPPVLKTPVDGAFSVEISPSFEWESSGEENYIIEVKNVDSEEVLFTSETNQTNYSTTDEFEHETSYLWRVKSVDEGGVESEWSQEWTFTTVPDENDSETGGLLFPGAPLQFSPNDGNHNASLTPTFQWSSIEGADYYVLHMSRNDPNGMVIDVVVEDTTYTHPEKLGDNSLHHWRVRAMKDGEPGEWSEIHELRTTDADLPEMADLIGPDHFSENISVVPLLEWEDVGVNSYRIRILDRETSDVVLFDETETTEYSPNDPLDAEKAYIWQVKSVLNGVEGAWSPRWEFTTGEYDFVLEPPILLSPDQGKEYETLTPTFEWENVDADLYIISVNREAQSNAKVLSGASNEETVIYAEVPETNYTSEVSLDPETTYFWRVKAIKNGEEGNWSETWEFMTPGNQTTVTVKPGESPIKTDLSQNYPNPFNPTTQIQYTLSNLQNVSLRVYDLTGRQVAVLVDEVKQAGMHSTTFDASNLASGVYIYRFISATHQFTKKMTLVK